MEERDGAKKKKKNSCLSKFLHASNIFTRRWLFVIRIGKFSETHQEWLEIVHNWACPMYHCWLNRNTHKALPKRTNMCNMTNLEINRTTVQRKKRCCCCKKSPCVWHDKSEQESCPPWTQFLRTWNDINFLCEIPLLKVISGWNKLKNELHVMDTQSRSENIHVDRIKQRNVNESVVRTTMRVDKDVSAGTLSNSVLVHHKFENRHINIDQTLTKNNLPKARKSEKKKNYPWQHCVHLLPLTAPGTAKCCCPNSSSAFFGQLLRQLLPNQRRFSREISPKRLFASSSCSPSKMPTFLASRATAHPFRQAPDISVPDGWTFWDELCILWCSVHRAPLATKIFLLLVDKDWEHSFGSFHLLLSRCARCPQLAHSVQTHGAPTLKNQPLMLHFGPTPCLRPTERPSPTVGDSAIHFSNPPFRQKRHVCWRARHIHSSIDLPSSRLGAFWRQRKAAKQPVQN